MSTVRNAILAVLIGTVLATLVGVLIVFGFRARHMQAPATQPPSSNAEEALPDAADIPIPFAESFDANLLGMVTPKGQRNGIGVFEVTFPEGENEETLEPNRIYLVRIPTRAEDMSLDEALTNTVTGKPGVDYYGYRYSSVMATSERTNAKATRFADRFPGVFFASSRAVAHDAQFGNALANFSERNAIAFRPTSGTASVPFGESLLILVVNDDEGAVLSLSRTPTCGDGVVLGDEECDDGNADDGDACTNACQAGIPIPFDERPQDTPDVTDGDDEGDTQQEHRQDDDTDPVAHGSCTDTDPSDAPGARGVVTATFVDGTSVTTEDQCAGGEVMQVSCDADTMTPGSPTSITCDSECSDGACVQTAAQTTCGNGIVERGAIGGTSESCDRGAMNGKTCDIGDGDDNCLWCNASCNVRVLWSPSCGDGVVQSGEACDDGNHFNGDGCSAGTVANGGCRTEKADPRETPTREESFVRSLADANSDGTISDTEALLLTLDASDALDDSANADKRFDIDGDGRVTNADILRILQTLDSLGS